jgi:hypothetical protein
MRALLLGLLTSVALVAQGPRGDYLLSGTVVNSVTGEPVKAALVSLRDNRGVTQSALTGVGGEYVFAGLPAAQCTLSAEKPGFLAGSPDQLSVSASLSNHTIKLTPLGVIEGRVSNQSGDPLQGLRISLFEQYLEDGERRVRPGRTGTTDDLGRFRLWDLKPGGYYVRVAGRAVSRVMIVLDGSLSGGEGFHPAYFGGSSTLESATPVTVGAGTEVLADFTLPMEPAYTVRGAVRGVRPGEYVALELLQSGSDIATSGVSWNGRTGTFDADAIPSGQYTIRAKGQHSWGEALLTVAGRDVNGVSIDMAPVAAVTGTVRVAAAAPGGTADSAGTPPPGGRQPLASSCNISLVGLGSEAGRTPGEARVQGEGEFSIDGVYPGRYRVVIQSPFGYVLSAVIGGSDLLANPEIVVQPGAPPPPIEIAVGPGGGSLTGKLTADAARPGVGLLLVPQFTPSTRPFLCRTFQNYGTPGEWAVQCYHLAPGDYLAYAIPGIQSVEYRNPEFLKTLSGGTSVRIEDAKSTEIALTSVVK